MSRISFSEAENVTKAFFPQCSGDNVYFNEIFSFPSGSFNPETPFASIVKLIGELSYVCKSKKPTVLEEVSNVFKKHEHIYSDFAKRPVKIEWMLATRFFYFMSKIGLYGYIEIQNHQDCTVLFRIGTQEDYSVYTDEWFEKMKAAQKEVIALNELVMPERNSNGS